MTNEDLLYLYFSKGLTESQQIEFDERLKSDAAFKTEFEFQSDLKHAIKSKHNIDLKSKLQGYEAEISSSKPEESSSLFNWRIAASIVILLGAGWFGYQSFFGLSYDDLFQDNFQEYPNTEYTITRSDTLNSTERKAFVAYESEDYQNAISYFDALDSEERKPYHNFYKAQAYLKLGDFEKAKPLLEKTIKESDTFSAPSYWYLGLIATKEKNNAEAIKNLESLIQNYDYNKQKAEALLKEIK